MSDSVNPERREASTSTSTAHTLAERRAKASMEASGGIMMVAGGVGVHGFNAIVNRRRPHRTKRIEIWSIRCAAGKHPPLRETNFTSPGSAGDAKQNAVVGWLEVETSKVSVSIAFEDLATTAASPRCRPLGSLDAECFQCSDHHVVVARTERGVAVHHHRYLKSSASAIKMRRAVPELPAWSTLTGGRRPLPDPPSIRHETDPSAGWSSRFDSTESGRPLASESTIRTPSWFKQRRMKRCLGRHAPCCLVGRVDWIEPPEPTIEWRGFWKAAASIGFVL